MYKVGDVCYEVCDYYIIKYTLAEPISQASFGRRWGFSEREILFKVQNFAIGAFSSVPESSLIPADVYNSPLWKALNET